MTHRHTPRRPAGTRSPVGRAALVLIAGCAAATAHAQSSVGISGFLDAGYYRGFDGGWHTGTIQRSNIAFWGKEDLGGGLQATFNLSHRFEMGTGQPEGAGSKPFWQGESTVGLKSADWGALRLGRALDVVSAHDWKYDPWGNFDRIASPAWHNWHYNYASNRTSNNGDPEYGRLASGVFYDSPTFSGFSMSLSGSFDEGDAAAGEGTGNNLGVALNYDQGPLALTAAHSKNSSQDRVSFIGARYRFGQLALMGAWDRSVYSGPIDSVARAYTVGLTYDIGLWTLKAGYGHRDVDGVDNNFIGLGASYALSKRTTLYVSAGNDRPTQADDRRAYGVGISHAF